MLAVRTFRLEVIAGITAFLYLTLLSSIFKKPVVSR